MLPLPFNFFFFFFFNDTATTEIYTLSLHDALPISRFRSSPLPAKGRANPRRSPPRPAPRAVDNYGPAEQPFSRPSIPGFAPRFRFARIALGSDRKSTRLNSSHLGISYAVFCLKKKK